MLVVVVVRVEDGGGDEGEADGCSAAGWTNGTLWDAYTHKKSVTMKMGKSKNRSRGLYKKRGTLITQRIKKKD